MRSSKVTIVKIGGSIAQTPRRAGWLDALAAWGGRCVIVPGGGPFADCVRHAQATMGFSDEIAHRLALIAMGQSGLALAAHSEAFTTAESRDELDRALSAGRFPVWLPAKMVLEAPGIPASWEVTSDSLAAWLAGTCGASRLLLIKSCDLAAPVSASELAAKKIVDPTFPSFAGRSHAEVWLAGPASLAGAAPLLQSGRMPGSIVTLS